ncbi:c-type cytochrome [Pelobium manganitolerans]|uniref:c-type cytochrome n=1 Tax=Pelobium manganitolerans TaxID=1842495 RepID=UPI003FA383F5
MKALKIILFTLGGIVLMVVAGATYVNFALPQAQPATQIRVAITPERVARGAYLANHVAVCMDCHSSRNWDLYSGPMVSSSLGSGGEQFDQKMGFPGKIYAPNITPYHLKNWTDGEILRAITTGVSKDGHALFPLMAYPRFGKMDKEDVYSIIAYIRTLKPIAKNNPKTELDFPVNLINKTLPKEADFKAKPAENNQIAYGAYLVNVAGCVDCHSKTEKGSVIAGTEFGGGMEFAMPNGKITSPNITMHKTSGLGNWSKQAFVSRFKAYADSNYRAQKVGLTVANTPMPWTMYAGMREKDLEAIYKYLNSLKPQNNKVEVRQYY